MATSISGSAGRHALVVGGSVTGLATVRVLSEHFEQVTLIERDKLPSGLEPRKGCPQAAHPHGLLKRGEQLASELFPDLLPALVAGGAAPVESGGNLYWHHFGVWKASTSHVIPAYMFSRVFLESEIRKRVLALPNVKLLDGCEVSGLLNDASKSRVTGVVMHRVGSTAEENISADLVVDACGRASKTPRWLEMIGRPLVTESIVKVDVGYATREFKRPPEGTYPWTGLFVIGQAPQSRRLAVLIPIEGSRWIVTLAGILGDHAPTDEQGWFEFAHSLPVPHLYNALKAATPLTDVATYKFAYHQRRHYERMKDLPDGLVVLGDSHCSFNPLYGQGMSTGIIGAVLLGQELTRARQNGGLASGLSRRFQQALAVETNNPWALSTGEDFRYPGVTGTRPFGFSLIQWYTGRMHRTAETDPEVVRSFFRVNHMLAPLSEMMRPRILFSVLRGPTSRVDSVRDGPQLASPPTPS